ncbi:Ig-like domain-containing protein [Inediibacterium massiliense]|uniref:Ig-like domain-containing protein n=1 Tax=Inediibacterium massiliense TaxID=1658111 RepID=UPI0006B55C26|nr:Ig-like domain-containing protein [Inediibacterium massiliense]
MDKRNIKSWISFLMIFTMIFTSTGFHFSMAQENEAFQVQENTVEDEVYKDSSKEKVEENNIDEDYSVRSMNSFMEGKTVEDDQTKFKVAIEDLKKHYAKISEYDYLTAMALNRARVDVKDIQGKLEIDNFKFEVGSVWSGNTSKEYAKAIMGIIAAGLDPTNYNGKNYVEFLVKCQEPEGYFKTREALCDMADEVAYCILALDMAGAEYDVDKAMKFLNSKITEEGNRACVKEFSGAPSGHLEKTCITLIALCSHKDKIEDSLIDKMVNFIKSEQLNCGVYGETKEDIETKSAKKTALVLQALAAAKVDIYQDKWKKTQDGTSITILDQLFTLKNGEIFKETDQSSNDKLNEEATKAVFAALIDFYTEKSMFHEIKIKLGTPHTIQIKVPNDQTQIKIGKIVSLSGKVFDANGKYIASEKLTWSSSDPSIAKIDEKKGILTAKDLGKVKITAKLQTIEESIDLEIVDVTPDKIEIKVDGDVVEIEEGRKIKITAAAYDTGGEIIENPDIKWSISPDDIAEFKDNIFTAKAIGEVSITASIEDKVTKTITLKIISRKEKIQKAIADIQEGFASSNDKYEYYTTLGLRHIGVDPSIIEDKANVYGKYYANFSDYAKNIITAVALGKDPKNYNGKDQIEKILNASKPFYEELDVANLSDAIIALDMANASYDKEKAIKYLINKVKNSSSLSSKSIAMIALSNHKKIDGVNDTIKIIQDDLKKLQDENGIIQNCETTSLAIQGLIAAGEDLYSDPWVKKDEYGNNIYLLDGLLKLKDGQKFRPTIKGNTNPSDTKQEQYALAALADLSKEKSMYHSIKHGDIEIVKIKEIKIESKDLSIQKGETKEVKVQAIDEKGQTIENPNLVWESLNPDIVKVEDGKIIGLKKGIGTIRIQSKDDEKIYTDLTVQVLVVYKAPNKAIITEPENTAVVKGNTLKLEVKVFDEDENELENPNLIWNSSDEKVGTIQDGIFTGIQKGSVDISVQVKDTNIQSTISLMVVDIDEEANHTIAQLTEGVKKYYQEIYYRENQGCLDAWESATLAKAGADLTKWGIGAQKKYCTKYDMNLERITSVIPQVLICLDLGEDPTNFEGRNLVNEVKEYLDNGEQNFASLNELKAVIALDEFNKKYPDKKVNYNVDKALKIIFAAQTENGGFKERGDSPVPVNTGYALKALSNHKGEALVDESIQKAIQYLKDIQKEDGGFCSKTYMTDNHAHALSGLLAVGENITSKEWTKNGKNPIDALFNLWKKNHSFDNKEGDSSNNRSWVAGTQWALYTLVDLKNAGYNNYLVKFGEIEEPVEEPEKTCTVYTAIVVPVGEKYDICYKAKEVVINNKKHSGGFTPIGALQATTPIYTMNGSMVTSICGIENQGMGGWMYTINDQVGDMNSVVKDGDKILWYYSAEGMEGKTPKWSEIADQKEEKNMKEEVQKAVDKGSNWLINNFNGADHWKAIGIARAGKEVPKNYLELLNEGNTLPKKDAGAYGKFILGILSAGGNPEHIGGHNFYQEICKLNLEKDKSAYTLPFGLLALDAIDYKLPKECSFTRDDLIKNLLEQQENGALKLETKYGGQSYLDDGALFILTALSKYSKENQEVKSVIDETFKQLETKQNKDGGFGLGKSSVETSALALMSMSLNEKNPLDESFMKDGKNVIEYLLSMQNKDGSFKSIGDVGMTTEQVVRALEQYLYALDKKGSIYDFIKNPVEKVELEDKNDFQIERIGNEAFKNNEEAYVIIKVKNLKERDQEASLIVALYDENNKMINYSVVSREIEPKEEVNMLGAFLVPEIGKYTVKAFVWDNEEDMNSLSRKIVIPVEN